MQYILSYFNHLCIRGLGILSDKLTHKNILTKFAVQIKCMESNLLIDKTQDEARQGEAYASQANSGVFEKFFYVGYYYRHFC